MVTLHLVVQHRPRLLACGADPTEAVGAGGSRFTCPDCEDYLRDWEDEHIYAADYYNAELGERQRHP